MSSFGGFAEPGMGALAETTEYEIIWGSERGQGQVLEQNANYDGAMRDAGNTPTTVIRAGLLMAKVTSTGRIIEWDASRAAADTDGRQDIFGIVPYELRAQDFDATNQNRVAGIIVRAPLKAGQLLIEGTALIGDTDEFLARRQLWAMGCILDDDTNGHLAGAATRYIEKITDYTIVAADNGTVFMSTTADTDYTLPTLVPGLSFGFVQTADFQLTVTSAGSLDDIIGANDASLDQVQFTTGGEQIGARMYFQSVYVGTTLKWVYYIQKVAFSTDDYLVSAAT